VSEPWTGQDGGGSLAKAASVSQDSGQWLDLFGCDLVLPRLSGDDRSDSGEIKHPAK